MPASHNRETPIRIVTQGDVKLAHSTAYMVVGGEGAFCMYIDIEGGRAQVEMSLQEDDVPRLYLSNEGADYTVIELPEFKGYRFHAGGYGKSLAIALAKYEG